MKNQRSLNLLILILGSITIFSCNNDNDIVLGHFPTTPVNLSGVNTEYDDYNSASPYYLYNEFSLVFSSNRNTQGATFDLVDYIVSFYYIESNDSAVFNVVSDNYWHVDTMLAKINTPANEFGPFMFFDYSQSKEYLMYASDFSGNLDLYYVSSDFSSPDVCSDPLPISKVNSNYNEAYPTINKYGDLLYFCSDSTGNFDIYHVNIGTNFTSWLKTEEQPMWIPDVNLNSDANDKCPYINRDLMVFSSDRAGGYGGYDLYYSEFRNGEWSAPINFGSEINTEYDEYRPITLNANMYLNNLMIFSSNRPGGSGGFDLYYVGISKMIF